MKKRAADLAESALYTVQWVDATALCDILVHFFTGVAVFSRIYILQARELSYVAHCTSLFISISIFLKPEVNQDY